MQFIDNLSTYELPSLTYINMMMLTEYGTPYCVDQYLDVEGDRELALWHQQLAEYQDGEVCWLIYNQPVL